MRTLALVVCSAAAALAQGGADIQKMEDAYVAAVRAKDVAALERFLAPDLVYTHSTGTVDDRSQFLAKLKGGDQVYSGIEYSNTKIRTYGKAAVLTASVRMTGSSKGVPFDNKLLVTRVWARSGGKKKAGEWQLVAHQTTRLP